MYFRLSRSLFNERQAELQIRGQGRSLAPDDIDFVEQAADLLAALQLWAEAQDRTDGDVREVSRPPAEKC
jgi:hypothetical protein